LGFFNLNEMASYQQVTITVSNTEEKEILVALLANAGYEGFMEEPKRLKAFLPFKSFDAALLDNLVAPFNISYTLEEIAERNWNADWEAAFEPVVVHNFVGIRAHFHAPVNDVLYDIIVTPKMSFGTGHHATTFMMVEAMQKLQIPGKKVLDFGTGTGVLAILAEKMGANQVHAIDNDSWSIDNAGENIHRNNCSHIALELAETLGGEEIYDIILANINKHVIMEQLPVIVKHIARNGVILISGLLQSDGDDLNRAIAPHNLTLFRQQERQSWLCWELTVKEKE
jgi:ribosomal protein L11 methyltransferase